MIPSCKTFPLLFRKYRLRAEFATLCDFGKVLVEEGYIFEDSIFSRWQKGSRIPQCYKCGELSHLTIDNGRGWKLHFGIAKGMYKSTCNNLTSTKLKIKQGL